MEVFIFILVLLIGIALGWVGAVHVMTSKSVGSLRIDTSDPDDAPYLFLELKKDMNYICKEQYVTLRVNTENFIPHK